MKNSASDAEWEMTIGHKTGENVGNYKSGIRGGKTCRSCWEEQRKHNESGGVDAPTRISRVAEGRDH